MMLNLLLFVSIADRVDSAYICARLQLETDG